MHVSTRVLIMLSGAVGTAISRCVLGTSAVYRYLREGQELLTVMTLTLDESSSFPQRTELVILVSCSS